MKAADRILIAFSVAAVCYMFTMLCHCNMTRNELQYRAIVEHGVNPKRLDSEFGENVRVP